MSRDFEAQQEAASGRRKVRYLAGQAVYDVPPGTLAEVLSDVRRGQLFQYALSRFLIEFHGDPDPASRRRRISDEPELGPNQCLNAILGAAGEHLARRWDLGEPPLWTTRPERFMDQPYFMNLHLPKSRLFEQPDGVQGQQLRGEANALQRRISQLTWQHCPLGQNLAHPLLQHRKIGYAR